MLSPRWCVSTRELAMATTEDKVAVLEKNLTGLRGTLDPCAGDFEVTRQQSMRLLEEKAMEMENNSNLAHAKVHELHGVSNKTIAYLASRVCALEVKEAEERERGMDGSVIRAVPRTWFRQSVWCRTN